MSTRTPAPIAVNLIRKHVIIHSEVTTLPRCIWKQATSVTIEVVWFHFSALDISNSVIVVDLFTLDLFQAAELTQVMSTLQADALSMLALQHDAQRPHRQTDKSF